MRRLCVKLIVLQNGRKRPAPINHKITGRDEEKRKKEEELSGEELEENAAEEYGISNRRNHPTFISPLTEAGAGEFLTANGRQ